MGEDLLFRRAPNAQELALKRVKASHDIVERLGMISPNRLHIKNHPIDRPVAVFNPAMFLENNTIKLLARIILGYYTYASAIALAEIPLDDIIDKLVDRSHYGAEIVLYPSTKYDLWGAEDPRTTYIDGRIAMVYTGRTVNYFNPVVRRERTLPVLALSDNGRRWKKVGVFVLPDYVRSHLISDKDAFVVKTPDGKLWLFHRPHLDDEKFYLVISRLESIPEASDMVEIPVHDTTIVLDPAPFEMKLGWAAPPIEVENNRWLALVHAVDKDMEVYRCFAVLLKYDGSFTVEAVTPRYIFEPKEVYEVYGDRPLVVFPCGNVRIDDEIVIAYGAGDYVVGFGKLRIDEVMNELDKGIPR